MSAVAQIPPPLSTVIGVVAGCVDPEESMRRDRSTVMSPVNADKSPRIS